MIQRILLCILLIAPCIRAQDSLHIERRQEVAYSWGRGNELMLDNNFAYVSTNTTGLRIVDVYDREHPVEAGFCDTPGLCQMAAKEGDILYLADGPTGIIAMSVSDPYAPGFLYSYDTDGFANEVAVESGILFVADKQGGISILDGTSGEQAILLSQIDTPANANALAWEEPYLYVACDSAGIVVYSLDSTFTGSTLECTIPLLRSANDVVLWGDIAYVVECDTLLTVIDITNPVEAHVVERIPVENAKTMKITQGDLYIYQRDDAQKFGNDLLLRLSLENPQEPEEVTRYYCSPQTSGTSISCAEMLNDTLYVVACDLRTESYGDFGIYQFYNGQSGLYFRISVLYRNTSPVKVCFENHSLFVMACENRDLEMWNVEDGFLEEIVHSSDRAYRPRDIVTFSTSQDTNYVFIITEGRNNYFIFCYEFIPEMEMDPFFNVEIGHYYPMSDRHRYVGFLTVGNNTLWALTENGRESNEEWAHLEDFAFADIPDWEDVYPMDDCLFAGPPRSITYHRQSVIIGCNGGVLSIGLSNFRIQLPGCHINDIACYDDYLFIPTQSEGLLIYSIANPLEPYYLNTQEEYSGLHSMQVHNGYLFGVTADDEIIVLDVHDPFNFEVEACHWGYNSVRNIDVVGNWIYAAEDAHVAVYELVDWSDVPDETASIPSEMSISVYPNPFNSSTRVQFTAQPSEWINISVYNILGRMVCTLFDGVETAGVHHLLWNGTSASGMELPSGVYLLRINGESETETEQVLLLR